MKKQATLDKERCKDILKKYPKGCVITDGDENNFLTSVFIKHPRWSEKNPHNKDFSIIVTENKTFKNKEFALLFEDETEVPISFLKCFPKKDTLKEDVENFKKFKESLNKIKYKSIAQYYGNLDIKDAQLIGRRCAQKSKELGYESKKYCDVYGDYEKVDSGKYNSNMYREEVFLELQKEMNANFIPPNTPWFEMDIPNKTIEDKDFWEI